MKKRLLANAMSSIVLVLTLAMLMVTPTSAGFTDKATTNLEVKAGTVKFNLNAPSDGLYVTNANNSGSFLNTRDIVPGSTFSKEATLTNSGEVSFTYTIADRTINSPGLYDVFQVDLYIDERLTYSGPLEIASIPNQVVEPGQSTTIKFVLRWLPTQEDTNYQSLYLRYNPSIVWTMGRSDRAIQSVRESVSTGIPIVTGLWYPRDLAITNITEQDAEVNWRGFDGFDQYIIEYSENSDFSNSNNVKVPGKYYPKTETSWHMLNYLKPDTTYYVRMQSVGTPAPGSWSPTQSFKTLPYE